MATGGSGSRALWGVEPAWEPGGGGRPHESCASVKSHQIVSPMSNTFKCSQTAQIS